MCRELKRNSLAKQPYSGADAQHAARTRRSAASSHTRIADWVWQAVEAMLHLVQAGPKQLAAWLDGAVSPESIYRWVYKQIALGKDYLAQFLRSGRCARLAHKVRRAVQGARQRPSIHARPAHVHQRQEPGHWEIDLLGSASHHAAALLTLTERASGATLVRRVYDKSAKNLKRAIVGALKPLHSWVKTITTDNGSEFARWHSLQQALDCRVYASEPACPQQRAIVEHTNGLLRQYLPKGSDAGCLSAAALKHIEFALNHRPRIGLDNRSPYQAFYDATGVALGS